MAIFEFLSLLNNLDIKIWIEDDQLRFRAPKGAMTAELKQQIKERKAEIIAFLQEAQTATQITSLSLVPVARDKDLPLSFAQQRMWFLSQLDGESTSYNESFQLRIVGKLSLTALEQSINEIIRRHEVLRTNFPTVEGVPFQVIRPNLTLSIPVINVQEFTETAVQEIINQEISKSFDLGTEPLIRATLLQQAPESHLLLITMHHIIIDGWSMGVFFKELEALYPAFIQGKPSPLTDLTIQYADFALWQREWLTKEVQDKQLEYWKQQLAGAPPLLELGNKVTLLPSQSLVDFLTVNKITHSFLSPSALSVLPKAKLPDLQCITVGGEACTTELVNQWGTERKLYNCYGPTESTVTATIFHCQPNSNKTPIGKAISNLRTYILDRNNQLLPPGIPGELCIAGVGLARGYLNRPETTAEKFLEIDICGQIERIYKTGDLARYLADGNIEYLGRIDNQVKIRGFRIELGEIETVLNQHPQIQTSCVIVREDNPRQKQLVSYIVPNQHSTVTISEMRQYLKETLPEYMVPHIFVTLETLPITPNGKIDRRALPKPELDSTIVEKYVAPRTPIEELLTQTWLQVLKVEQVGIDDNFFELGGHSLLATQLVSRIRNIFQVELPLNKLFAAPTVRELASIITQLQQDNLEMSTPLLLPRAKDADLPMSFAQQRLWFLDQFEPNSVVYNIPTALHLRGKLHSYANYMIPTVFVMMEGLPVTTNGKVDRRALPAPSQEIDLTNFVLPTTHTQKLIADIWSSVLGTTHLGIHNNFFDMGGNSLRAMQVMSLLRKTLQIDLPLRYLFENPTVAELAAGLVETLYTTSLPTNQTNTISTTSLDLKAEAVLDPSIQIRREVIYSVSTEYNNKPQGIFLTGVTGFLGSHLLYELLQHTQADIYCLIRATDIEQARQKLQNQLQLYKLWSGVDRKRIIPVVGDLGKNYLGLSTSEFQKLASQIDVIYHCGAWINVIYPYSVLKPANVLGTQEIIRLASEIKVKPLHYISTTSVLSAATPNEAGLILESDLLEQYQGLENGYVQSKWVAEKLVMQARDLGLPVAIYRASRITGNTQTGISNTDDLFCRLVKGCLETRIFPDVQMEDNLTPVDYVSKIIVNLSGQKESLGKAFHLVNPESTTIRDLFHLMHSLGYPVQMIPVEKWHSEISLESQISDTDNLRVLSHIIPKVAVENQFSKT